MSKKDIKAERQKPNAVPTQLQKVGRQEPTAATWGQGGDKSASDALARDKSTIRKPIGPGDTTAPGK